MEPSPDSNDVHRRLILGGLVGNAAAASTVGASFLLAKLTNDVVGTSLAIVNVAIVPVIVGLVAAWWWRKIPMGRGEVALHSMWVCGIGLVGAALAFSEGVLCLAMAAPLHYGAIALSIGFGHRIFGGSGDGVRVVVLPFAALGMMLESRWAPPPGPEVFADEIRIHAPPAAVWPHVVSFAPIAAPPDFWFFRMGLPYPMETPPGADAVGKERLCIFSGGVVFKEKVVVFEPNRRLAFDIVEQPPDPELLGHFETHRGEFELRDEGDGTTTLIGRSTYTLHMRPHWYFDGWTRHLGRAVHLRVMENARRLAESH
ncbi:MAG: hypothetical protein DVB31_01720 [Verrucomicrobia bacterium]|nr:MAG: hypothetical protein DVB31_01720 [Verrucomicrobiota bacterium]